MEAAAYQGRPFLALAGVVGYPGRPFLASVEAAGFRALRAWVAGVECLVEQRQTQACPGEAAAGELESAASPEQAGICAVASVASHFIRSPFHPRSRHSATAAAMLATGIPPRPPGGVTNH